MEMVTLGRCPRVFSPTVLIRDNRRQEISFDLQESLSYLQRISELRFQLLCRNCPTCQNLSNNQTPGSPSLSLKSTIGHHHGYSWFNESVPCVTNSFQCHEASAVAQHNENNVNEHDERVTNKTKVFMCPYCPVTCSNRGQLLGHVRIHTGERPFVCQEPGCNKAFIRNEELTRHRRIHTGERPYRCATCTKAFTRKDHLNKHVKIHLNDDTVPR